MAGVKRNEALTEVTRGLGARFYSVATVGGREIEVELEMTAWRESKRMVVTSVKGPRTRGTWTFAENTDGTTAVTLKYEYELPAVFRLVPGAVVRGTVESGLNRSLDQLKQQVEAAVWKTARQRTR